MKMHSKRRHGFSGQRMVVVPTPVWERLGSHALLCGMRVTDAGFFPRATSHFVQRNQGVPAELLIACIAGAGRVCINGGDALLIKPGDVAWLPAGVPHWYESDPVDPWTIEWVHFAGHEVEAWRNLVFEQETGHLCRVPIDRMSELALDRLHSILEQGYSLLNLIEAAAALRSSLGVLSRLRRQVGATWSAQSRVAASVEHLRCSWMHLHRLEELAAQAGVSPSHYSTLFRKQTGFSPLDFILRQRMQHAAFLLVTTNNSISAIAAAVGYDDAYYFSRCFGKIMGCSPRAYRKKFETKR